MKDTYDKVYAVAKKLQANKNNRKEDFKAVLEEYKKTFTAEELAEKKIDQQILPSCRIRCSSSPCFG